MTFELSLGPKSFLEGGRVRGREGGYNLHVDLHAGKICQYPENGLVATTSNKSLLMDSLHKQ